MTYQDAKKALMLLGYPVDATDTPTALGPTTRQSIMAFQRSQGTPDHGMLDEDTQKRLLAAVGGAIASPAEPFDWDGLLRFTMIGVGVAGLCGVAYEVISPRLRAR